VPEKEPIGNAIAKNLHVMRLVYESATDNITAFAGGGQANAAPLNSEINRVTTVATAGDSVLLPPSKAGLTIFVINGAARPMQVYGFGTDTVDGVATGTGVTQMQGSSTIYSCTTAGAWFTNGIGTGYAGSLPTVSSTNGIVAHAGGGQGSATPLTTVQNRIVTVASANDSVQLPTSSPGLAITVINAATTNSMNVFPVTGDQINALAVNTAFAVASGKTATFSCVNAGQWHSLLSA
jgi:hypothetical protein